MKPAPTILIVDDERDLRELLDYNLRQAGFNTVQAATGSAGLEAARKRAPDLVVLDLNLPDLSGTDVCRRLRADAATAALPILMLTARTTESDRVDGFEVGADDYVIKPFSVRELILRVEAILRRTAPERARASAAPSTSRLLRIGPVEIDRDAFVARLDGQELALPLLEFRLLAYLLESAERVCTRDELLQNVWGYAGGVETRTLDTHVARLRDRLGTAGDLIETVRGVGFRIRATADQA